MNMSAMPPAASTACDRCAASNETRETRETLDPAARETFELVLQMRQRQQRSSDDGDGDGEQPPRESALLPALLPALQARTQTLPPLSSAGALDPAPTGTRAVVEASLRESPCPLLTPVGGSEAAMTWEATVHEPNSLALEVRAVRAERSDSSAPPGWSLTIASPSVGVEVLARHAPRLNERLRKHAIGLDHVRIERSEEDDQ
jgi:hypothetical protein